MLTSCNSTREELVAEFCGPQRTAASTTAGRMDTCESPDKAGDDEPAEAIVATSNGADVWRSMGMESQELSAPDSIVPRVKQQNSSGVNGVTVRFKLVDWVRTYPTFRYGGVEGTRVCTVAFRKVDGV